MDVLLVRLRFPFYSVARRSFQVRTSLILPSPSALKGALARGLVLLRGADGENLDDVARKAVEELDEKLVDAKAVGVAPLTPMVKTAFLLKRLRNLEKGSKPEKDDAMRREYVFTKELLVAYIFKNLTEEEKNLYLRAAMLIDTLGDTESLSTVVWAGFVKPLKNSAPLAFYAPYGEISNALTKKVQSGGAVRISTETMLVSPDYGSRREEVFYLPIEERRKKRVVYYERTAKVPDVEGAIELDGEVFGIWIPGN
ncbi:type I-A CRISPR-associated protein Cas5a [Thermococcus thioreducens]|uniref:CRISPR-associated protein Cas5 n=1 Tax=Thermococcus thioreducens TaxID=277988 RepID=A0A0Q2QRU9_9EURY|nr:type I-A CRISPR-associated protein Cas5a [Thermococcus thioreducens]ASJ12049.1 type I-A CRISPR-associated protein Cas5 [Thermococcus thioreducens]KQH82733.1 CRISPR-associated protein Cas5 [Thermococcus thioreducens]SEW09367.1 CRISPR-associated protein Cas5a/b/c [Thermococcus thioreducens]